MSDKAGNSSKKIKEHLEKNKHSKFINKTRNVSVKKPKSPPKSGRPWFRVKD
jgi:hypothetical protein